MKRFISLVAVALAAVTAGFGGTTAAQASTAHCTHIVGNPAPFLGGPVSHLDSSGNEYESATYAWQCSPNARAHWRLEYESGGTWHFADCTVNFTANQPCTADDPGNGSYTSSSSGGLSAPDQDGWVTNPINRATGTSCSWNLRFKVTFEFVSIPNEDTFSNTSSKTC